MKLVYIFVFLCSLAFSNHEIFLRSYLKQIPYQNNPVSGLKGVDCIYVINLDKHSERWHTLNEQLLHLEFYAQRVSAVNGWSFDRQELKRLYHGLLSPSCHKFSRTPGMLGCFLSHMSILKEAYEKNYQAIWVLEDDCILEGFEKNRLENILNELNEKKIPWDALYTDTGSRYLHPDGTLERYDFDKICSWLIAKCSYQPKSLQTHVTNSQWIQRRLGMYSVILSQTGIKKIWEYFSTHKLQWAYDVDINFIEGKRFLQTKEDIVSTVGAFGSSTYKNK